MHRFWECSQHKCLNQLSCAVCLQSKKAKKTAASEQLDVEADAEEEAELARMREAGFATGAEAKGAAAAAVCSVQRPSACFPVPVYAVQQGCPDQSVPMWCTATGLPGHSQRRQSLHMVLHLMARSRCCLSWCRHRSTAGQCSQSVLPDCVAAKCVQMFLLCLQCLRWRSSRLQFLCCRRRFRCKAEAGGGGRGKTHPPHDKVDSG
jgi:hypothetical protein